MELTNALRSKDPENFISHIPVHQVDKTGQTSFITSFHFVFLQDGSCNGLQHYAALGRDIYGAKQVCEK